MAAIEVRDESNGYWGWREKDKLVGPSAYQCATYHIFSTSRTHSSALENVTQDFMVFVMAALAARYSCLSFIAFWPYSYPSECSEFFPCFTDHISGIPNLYCLAGTLVESWAIERCSGNGRRAVKSIKFSLYRGHRGEQTLRCRYPRLPYTPRSLLMPDLLDIQYLCTKSGHISAWTGMNTYKDPWYGFYRWHSYPQLYPMPRVLQHSTA